MTALFSRCFPNTPDLPDRGPVFPEKRGDSLISPSLNGIWAIFLPCHGPPPFLVRILEGANWIWRLTGRSGVKAFHCFSEDATLFPSLGTGSDRLCISLSSAGRREAIFLSRLLLLAWRRRSFRGRKRQQIFNFPPLHFFSSGSKALGPE